ncbi:MAG: hypothetical protein NT103_07545 [Campylobacterales bacterium]|nr:hypothetical protein [Campylobacterales bacterium]
MQKIALFALLIGAVFISDASAFVDMSQVSQRAANLNMATKDYALAMAIAGALTGFAFGMFLWKAR